MADTVTTFDFLNMDDLKIADRVALADETNAQRFPGVWTVVGKNKSTVKLAQGSRQLSASPFLLRRATANEAEAPDPVTFTLGEVVTLARKDGFFVVIKANGTKYNLAALGGDGDRYYRSVPAHQITGRVQLRSDFATEFGGLAYEIHEVK